MSLTFNMVGGGGSVAVLPGIYAQYPEGSICTCTNGVKTFTAGDTTGFWLFAGLDIGTWTVTATDGTDTTSQTVETTKGQLASVELSYELWLYKAGNEYTDVTGGWSGVNDYSGYTDGTLTKNTGSITLKSPATRRVISAVTENKISLSGRKTLNVNLTAASFGTGRGAVLFIYTSDAATHVAAVDITGKGTTSLDISDYASGSYYVGIECYSESNATAASSLTYDKVWLK